MRRTWLACGVAALAVISCGGEPAQQQEAKQPADCREASSDLKDALESSLSGVQNAELTGVRYVEVESPPEAPLSGFEDGMYIVSGLLQDRAADGEPLTFAANHDMVSSGGGLAFAIDPVTREFFEFGTSAVADSPARGYIDAIQEEPEYEQARECAQQG